MADETETEVDLKKAMEILSAAAQAAAANPFKTKPIEVTFTPGGSSGGAPYTAIVGSVSVGETESEVEGDVKVPKVPVTATKMDPYEAARRLRTQVKALSTPAKMLEPVDAALLELRDAMSGRSPRKKAQAFEAVVTELETYRANAKFLLREIQLLAQNIPTQPNLPSTPDENIVRAIVAILKSNGRVKT